MNDDENLTVLKKVCPNATLSTKKIPSELLWDEPGREADHSLPSSAGVKNAWSYTPTLPVRHHGVVLSASQEQLYLHFTLAAEFRWQRLQKFLFGWSQTVRRMVALFTQRNFLLLVICMVVNFYS